MFSRISTRAFGLGAAVVLTAASLTACGSTEEITTTTPADTTTTATTALGEVTGTATAPSTPTLPEAAATGISALAVGGLSVQDQDALILMREEEKLAHDVYVTLGDLWGLRIFENIAAAETVHTEAVASIIERYGLDDPAVGNEIGVFTNPDFAALYVDLVERGSESLVAALAVGAFIEDLDIFDLQQLLESVDSPAITRVFETLQRGSRNHLRAFSSQLESRGETYSPSYLTQAEYDAIVNSPTERGRAFPRRRRGAQF